MKRKHKVLVFVQSAVGGAERMSITVTKTLDRQRFEVIYCLVGTRKQGKGQLENFIPNDLQIRHISRRNPIFLIATFLMMLAREKPDVVFSSVLNLNNKLLLLRSLFKKTKFIIRADNYLYTYSRKQRRIIGKTYPKADVIITQTEEMKQELDRELHLPEDKTVTLYNPIDTATIETRLEEGANPYPDDGSVRYVASGRFAKQKGFDLLVEAFAVVKKEQPQATLYIVGKNDGICEPEYGNVRKLIVKHRLEESVKCVGFQSNPYVYLKYADCFVLSSRWEGLPNVMLESLYLGTPVAAFKCIPVIERIITEGKDGYLAEKEDAAGLAKAMLSACKLGKITSSYKSAKIEDFQYIFEYGKPIVEQMLNGGGQIPT